MSLKILMNSFAVATISATAVLAAPAAEAREWRRGGHERNFDAEGSGGWRNDSHDRGPVNRWGDVRDVDHGDGRGSFAQVRSDRWRGHGHRDRFDDDFSHSRTRDDTARNIAIGAFAAFLGLAIAAGSQQDEYPNLDE